MKKKLISLLLVLMIILSYIPCIYATGVTDSGQCGENLNYVYENGILTISGIGGMTDYYGPAFTPWSRYASDIETIILPNGITHIGNGAFGYTKIKSINIPNTVMSIGNNAFQDCHELTNITIPVGVKRISEFLFSNCRALKNVIIPPEVNEIANAAFHECKSLETVAIPKSVKKIGLAVFQGCDSLSYFDYGGNDYEWNCIDISIYGDIETSNKELFDVIRNNDSYISVALNGRYISFSQLPVIRDGRTLVPLRAIFEEMGATIEWKDSTQTVISTLDDTTVNLTIGSNVLYKNGVPITLDVPAQLIKGYTMVPVRAVAEAFDADVKWNNETKTVYITTKGNTYTLDTIPQITYDEYAANFADYNGMYIDSFTHSTNEDGSGKVKFDVYNTQYIYGVVEIYYPNGNLKDVAIIDKMSNPTSIKGATIDNVGKLVKDLWNGTALTYRQESGYSKKTSVNIDIPKGGYIKITNDMMESFIGSVINLADIAFSAKKTYSALSGFSSDTSKDFVYKLSSEVIKNAAFAEMVNNPAKYTEKLWKGFSGELYMNSESIGGFLDTVSKNLDEFSDGKLAELVFSTAKSCGIGIAESTFEALTGPVGVALKAIFTITSVTDTLMEMNDGLNCLYKGSININAI